MATFPRGHHATTTHHHNQRQLQRPQLTHDIHTSSSKTWHLDPSDTRTLRGIPAIGRGVQGAIPGTRPDLTPSDTIPTIHTEGSARRRYTATPTA